jgi:hypothetical protein
MDYKELYEKTLKVYYDGYGSGLVDRFGLNTLEKKEVPGFSIILGAHYKNGINVLGGTYITPPIDPSKDNKFYILGELESGIMNNSKFFQKGDIPVLVSNPEWMDVLKEFKKKFSKVEEYLDKDHY